MARSGETVAVEPGRLERVTDWLFRNRTTGRITIVQFPNAALWLFLVASVLHRLLSPTGHFSTALRLIADGGLLWWAVDELTRGVNPWRRLLGAAVLAGKMVQYLP